MCSSLVQQWISKMVTDLFFDIPTTTAPPRTFVSEKITSEENRHLGRKLFCAELSRLLREGDESSSWFATSSPAGYLFRFAVVRILWIPENSSRGFNSITLRKMSKSAPDARNVRSLKLRQNILWEQNTTFTDYQRPLELPWKQDDTHKKQKKYDKLRHKNHKKCSIQPSDFRTLWFNW